MQAKGAARESGAAAGGGVGGGSGAVYRGAGSDSEGSSDEDAYKPKPKKHKKIKKKGFTGAKMLARAEKPTGKKKTVAQEATKGAFFSQQVEP